MVAAGRSMSFAELCELAYKQRVPLFAHRVGAGPIVLIISNQSSTAQKVTFETNELGGSQPGRKFDTTPMCVIPFPSRSHETISPGR